MFSVGPCFTLHTLTRLYHTQNEKVRPVYSEEKFLRQKISQRKTNRDCGTSASARKLDVAEARRVLDSCLERNNIILTEIPRATRDESRGWKSTSLVGKDVRNFGNNPRRISSIRRRLPSPDVTNAALDLDRFETSRDPRNLSHRLSSGPYSRGKAFFWLQQRERERERERESNNDSVFLGAKARGARRTQRRSQRGWIAIVWDVHCYHGSDGSDGRQRKDWP